MANGLFNRPSPATGRRGPNEIMELYGQAPERGMGHAARRAARPGSGSLADILERVQGQGSPQQMPTQDGSPPSVANPRQRMAQEADSDLDIGSLIERLNRMGQGDNPLQNDPRMTQARRDTGNQTPQDMLRGRSLGSPQQMPQEPLTYKEDTLAYEGPIESLPNETELSDRDILADIVSRPERGPRGGSQPTQQTAEQQGTPDVDTRLPPGISASDLEGEDNRGFLERLMSNPETGNVLLDLGTRLMATESPDFLQALGQAGQGTLQNLQEREAAGLERQMAEAQIAESEARSEQMQRSGQEIMQDSQGRLVRISDDGEAEFVTMEGIPIRSAVKQAGLTGMEKQVADIYKSKLENQPLDPTLKRPDNELLAEAIGEAQVIAASSGSGSSPSGTAQ